MRKIRNIHEVERNYSEEFIISETWYRTDPRRIDNFHLEPVEMKHRDEGPAHIKYFYDGVKQGAVREEQWWNEDDNKNAVKREPRRKLYHANGNVEHIVWGIDNPGPNDVLGEYYEKDGTKTQSMFVGNKVVRH